MTKIKERHPNDIVLSAKAMIYGWKKCQGKPTPQKLLTKLSIINLPVPNQSGVACNASANSKMSSGDVEGSRNINVSLFPKLPINNCTDEPGLGKKQTDEDFLFFTATLA